MQKIKQNDYDRQEEVKKLSFAIDHRYYVTEEQVVGCTACKRKRKQNARAELLKRYKLS